MLRVWELGEHKNQTKRSHSCLRADSEYTLESEKSKSTHIVIQVDRRKVTAKQNAVRVSGEFRRGEDTGALQVRGDGF